MTEERIFTYQTKVRVASTDAILLTKTAEYLSKIEHALFAEFCKGHSLRSLKNAYVKLYEITARQFNAIVFQLEGKIAACRSLNQNHIKQTQTLLDNLNSRIKRIKNPEILFKKHQQRRRLEKKLAQLLDDAMHDKIRLCFGSKKLFKQQYHLEENGLLSHEEWQKKWHQARHDSFFTIGSKDESCGNQTCQARLRQDGLIDLYLRLPTKFIDQRSKYLVIEKVHFAYGHEVIVAAIKSCQKRAILEKSHDPSSKNYGRAIGYRFKQAADGSFYIFASTTLDQQATLSSKAKGAIGIDINHDHIALVEIDHHGNPIFNESLVLVTYGKDKHQASALVGDVAARVVAHALKVNKPIVLEDLDFQKKKEQLKEKDKAYARMLSSFSYQKILSAIQSRAYRNGIEVLKVNPAYTSVMGQVKYALRFGLTIHQAAALCIARRGINFSEKIPRQLNKIPDGKGGFIRLTLPVRKGVKKEKHSWVILSKKLKAELAAHFWTIEKKSILKNGKTAGKRRGEASSEFTFETRYANRQ